MYTTQSHTTQTSHAHSLCSLLSCVLCSALCIALCTHAQATPTPMMSAELGGVWGPKRSEEERARLPWRPREGLSLYPARLEVGLKGQSGPWRYALEGRLVSSLVLAGNEQAEALSDPLGRAPQLNNAWVARIFEGARDTLTLKVGRWVPVFGAEGPLDQPNAWSLEAREGLTSHAQDPRDRAVSGLELSWAPTRLHLISVRAFTPSDTHALIAQDRLGLGGALALLWRGERGEGVRLDTLALELGAHSYETLRWARGALSITGPVAQGGAHLKLITRALYRERRASRNAEEEATLSAFGLDGAGLSVSHELSYLFGSTSTSARLSVGYAWRDPQLSFKHNAQHALPLSVSAPIYQDRLELRLEYRHLWSDKSNRASLSSDLTLLCLRYQVNHK